LIEAFNLKAAIEYSIKNYSAAKEALVDMPPREEDGNDFSKSRIGPCNTNELSTYEY
jgi:hypothetical protein